MTKPPEQHALNWDLRHQDFNDNDYLYDVYAVMRETSPFAHTDTPFLDATPGGAWVATRYAECHKILQDWRHFSSNPTPEGAERLAGDLVITLDPPRQQKFRKVLNPHFSPARMKGLRPQITAETDLLIDDFIEAGTGDLAQIAWRQPGIVLFKYLLGMPIDDVPLCIELTDAALNGHTEEARMAAWGGLYQHLHDAVTARTSQPPRDDMIDVLRNAEIDGERLPLQDVVSNAMLLVQAGLETTASAMSFAFHYLATQPEERDRLIREPEILPRAVEEFIRYAGSIHGIPRTVADEVEMSGHTSVPASRFWSTTPLPTVTPRNSRNRTAASSTVGRIGISGSEQASIVASVRIWHAWSSRSGSSEFSRECPTSLSNPAWKPGFTGTL